MHLCDYWFSESFSFQDKKELLRCLMEYVFLESHDKVIRTRVCWYGGAISELDVPKYFISGAHIYHRISELARTHTDREIASILKSFFSQFRTRMFPPATGIPPRRSLTGAPKRNEVVDPASSPDWLDPTPSGRLP